MCQKIFYTVIILFMLGGIVNAEQIGDVVGYGGISYNSSSESDLSGVGFFTGLRKWQDEFNGKNYALGGEIEQLHYSEGYKNLMSYDKYRLLGLTGLFVYNLDEANRIFDMNIYSNLGIYIVTLKPGKIDGNNINTVESNKINPGGKLGIEFSKELHENIKFRVKFGYRMVKDFSSFETAGQFSMKF